MNKIFLALFLTVGCIIAACTMGSIKNDTSESDSNVTIKQDAGTGTNSGKESPEDPDPSDTISASAYGINTYGKETEKLVRTKLQAMYKDDLARDLIDSFSRRFIFFTYDLNDDGVTEIFVGLTGPYFCGSGGCTILLLNNKAGAITQFTVTDYPVIIADTKSNGWKDLVLMSRGKNHLVKFNGKAYPSNPSVQPLFKNMPGDSLPRALNFTTEPYAWFSF
jgi:hypothetical protein